MTPPQTPRSGNIDGLTFGRRVAVEMTRLGLRQEDVGAALGRTQTAVSYWVNDKREPTLADLCALADLLHVSTDHLLGSRDTPPLPDHDGIQPYPPIGERDDDAMPPTDAPRSGRIGWDGYPVPERFLELAESYDIALRELAGVADADRAFGGDGTAVGDDPASRLARDYVFMVQEMRALAEAITGLAAGQGGNARWTVEERLGIAGRTAQAILDHLPERAA